MKSPQVINLNEDTVIAIDSASVIDDIDQIPLNQSPHSISSIAVTVYLWNLMANIEVGPVSATMNYQGNVDIWTILLSELTADPTTLLDRNKYVAMIICADSSNMRDFKLNEFCIDNDSFEDTWMRLPYQVECGATSYIVWYDSIDPTPGTAKYRAKAYEGGKDLVYATDPSRVTHRGPVEPVV
jgi:hypothetical protein